MIIYEIKGSSGTTQLRYENEDDARRECASRFPDGSILKNSLFVPVYRCPECGGLNVEGTAWVDLQTNLIVDSESPTDDYFCADCDDNINSVEEVL